MRRAFILALVPSLAWAHLAYGQDAVQRTGPVVSNTPTMWASDKHPIAGGVMGLPIALTNAALAELSTTDIQGVIRAGYSNPGDAPPLMYVASAAPCTLNSGAGDGGSQVKSSDGKCWIASPDTGGMDVRQWGARDDAVPGIIGQACDGITGTDSTTAFRAAVAYAIANSSKVVAGGKGYYRLHDVIRIETAQNYWSINDKRPPEINFSQPIVTCGNNAAFHFVNGNVMGLKMHISALIGPGAGASAPAAGSYAENVGVLFDGADGHMVTVGSVTDYTYDVLFNGSFTNTLYVGTAIAAYKAIYLRNGVPGNNCVNCQSAANKITFENVGGIYTSNTDPEFANKQKRSSYWGIHLAGESQGNVITGGALQYAVKGDSAVNLQVDGNYNYITTWLEGHQGASGQDLVVNGSNNHFNLSNMASPSSNMTKHITVHGTGNRLWGPKLTDASQGSVTYEGHNYVNGDAIAVVYPPSLTCSSGRLTSFTSSARYKLYGSIVWYEVTWKLTNAGTCAGTLNINLPAASGPTFGSILAGRNTTTGEMLQCFTHSGEGATLKVQKASGTFPGATGQGGYCSGWYNAQ